MPSTKPKNPIFGFFFRENDSSVKPVCGGFTLVELLLVVSLLGIMTTILLSVINTKQQTNNANDAVMRTNLEKLVTGLESYRTIEGRYPTDPNSDGNPKDDSKISTYIRDGWLSDEPPGTVYMYSVNGSGDEAGIAVTLNSKRILKYRTAWGQIRDCAAPASAADDGCNL